MKDNTIIALSGLVSGVFGFITFICVKDYMRLKKSQSEFAK